MTVGRSSTTSGSFSGRVDSSGADVGEPLPLERDPYLDVNHYDYAWTGAEHVVVGNNMPGGTTRLIRWDTEGALLDSVALPGLSDMQSVEIAWNDGVLGVAWIQHSDELRFMTIGEDGELGEARSLSGAFPSSRKSSRWAVAGSWRG